MTSHAAELFEQGADADLTAEEAWHQLLTLNMETELDVEAMLEEGSDADSRVERTP